MKWFQDLSIRYKITIITVTVTLLVLFICFILILFYWINNYRTHIREKTLTTAKLVADNCLLPITFNDQTSCQQILSNLDNISSILGAELYDKKNNLFAEFVRSGYSTMDGTDLYARTGYFSKPLIIEENILLRGEKIGMIKLTASTSELSTLVYNQIGFMILLIIFLIIISGLLASAFQKILTAPILHLATSLKKVGVEDNYSVTLSKISNDEVGMLYDEFNSMLEKINQRRRDKELVMIEMRNQYEKFLTIFNSFPEILYISDIQSQHTLFANQKVKELLKYDPTNRPCHEFLEKLDLPCDNGKQHILVKDKKTITHDHYSRILNRHFMINSQLIGWPDGRDVCMEIAIDITDRFQAEEKLKETSLLLETTLNAIPDLIGIQDVDQTVIKYNKAGYEMVGKNQQEIQGHKCYELIGRKNRCELCATALVMKTGKPAQIEKYETELGIWIDARTYPIFNEAGEIVKLVEHVRDITARKKATEALLESERHLRAILDHSPIAIIQYDYSHVKNHLDNLKKEGVATDKEFFVRNPVEVSKCLSLVEIVSVNNAALELFKAKNKQEIIENRSIIYTEATLKAFAKGLELIFQGTNFYEFETVIRNLAHEEKHCIVRIAVTPGHEKNYDMLISSLLDITAHKVAEEKIRNSLAEKEVLLKEIHHRVKNNLQIIASLLNMQINYITDASAREYLAESLNRVKSMAFIHENLYQSKNFKDIDFSHYINLLLNQLFITYGISHKRIKLHVEIEKIFLNINLAIPLGLIINELVTNSLKYAFPEKRTGMIRVKLNKVRDKYILQVEDDGIGLPEEWKIQTTKSLGLQLVKTLIRQINGNIQSAGKKGTCFRIDFPGSID
ncbi:MAG: PAS domain S-box protein [Candidatus Cloacimonetes bacterium]|nr:PAS domain S-box protein [Candidatus Cloacimonadota bacterium]